MNVFVTAIIGALGLLIAFRQWRTAHDKVRLDLFDRRMAIYETFVNAGSAILFETAKEGEDPRAEIDKAMNRAQFLFGEDVIVHLKRFHDAACRRSNLVLQWKASDIGDRRNALEDEMHKAGDVLHAAFEGFETPFMPYLSLTQKSNELWPSDSLVRVRRLLGR